MITEITSLITSAKAAYDITQGVNALKSEVDRNQAISEILKVLVSVQFQASAMLSKAHELEIEKHNLTKKLMDFENWAETEKQYELKEIASGIFVYEYKAGGNPEQPIHQLCAKCFQERKKSILQRTSKSMAGIKYICHTCNSEILDHSKSESLRNYYPNEGGGPGSWMGA